jgi:hypothetical protein
LKRPIGNTDCWKCIDRLIPAKAKIPAPWKSAGILFIYIFLLKKSKL